MRCSHANLYLLLLWRDYEPSVKLIEASLIYRSRLRISGIVYGSALTSFFPISYSVVHLPTMD